MFIWLGAADERGAVGGRLDRVGVVLHRAGDDGGLAAVADTGAARPADWYVACFCELEQTGVFRTPGNSEVAAGELDCRPRPGCPCRHVRGPGWRWGDAGGLAGRRAEELDVDAARVETKLGECGTGFAHERCGATEVSISVAWQLERGEHGRGEPACRVEVSTFDIVRPRAAVCDLPYPICE